MAKTAKFQVYNGLTWEELKFPPSDHTHDNYCTEEEVLALIQNAGGGGNADLSGYLPTTGGEISGYLIIGEYIVAPYVSVDELFVGPNDEVCIDDSGISTPLLRVNAGDIYINTNHGLKNNNGSGSAFGFNDEDCPTIVGADGTRRIGVATDELAGNYIYYTFPEKSGTVALLDDIPSVPKYYIHTLTINGQVGGTQTNISFTVFSTRSTAYTVSTLYSAYPSKAFAASGYYGTNAVSKIAIISSSTARIVYGQSGSTVTGTIGVSDTVIPVV